ncbi:MAG: hypothetical protein R6V50_08145 [Thermoplasmatota archaeon]
MNNILVKQCLGIAVIILFISVAFVPSINASAIDKELVEFDVEICGLGKKNTVKLTQQEAYELELLFADIQQRLSEIKTREETEEIFKEAVVELDKYSLLGGLSVKQAQQLVVGSTVQQNLLKSINGKDVETFDDDTANYLCLIAGHLSILVSQSHIVRRFTRFMEKLHELSYALGINEKYIAILELIIFFYLLSPGIIFNLIPFSFFRVVGAGYRETYFNSQEPSEGWVHSFGLNGNKSWEGKLYGVASEFLIYKWGIQNYPAILGFTGIILYANNYGAFFLGSALKAAFSNERP